MTKVALGTITNLAATAGDTQVTLNWTAASGATSQQPRFATASGGPWTNFGAALSGTATTVTVTGLTNGTLYFFTVTATDGATTTTSNEVSATPKLPAPGAITNLAVGTVTATSVALSWTPATGAATHYIMRRLKPTFTPNNLPGIRLWLDAQNEAERRALATNQSALLDLWVDSSTNAANFEQAGANPKPLLIHDGTRWVVRFDGTDDCMMAISTKLGMLRNVPGATVIAGVRTNLTVLVIASVSTGGAAGSARATLNRNNLTANTRTGGRRLDADAFSAVDSPNNAFASGAWGIQSGRIDYTARDARTYLNGSELGLNSAFQTAGNTSDTDSLAIAVGSNPGQAAEFMNGDLVAVIVTATALSVADRQAAESYLNTRYNLGLTLP